MVLEASPKHTANVIKGKQESIMTSNSGKRDLQNMLQIKISPWK